MSTQRLWRLAFVLFVWIFAANSALGEDSWQRLTGVGLGRINEVCWADKDHAWLATSDGSLLTTRDGGKSWQSPSSMFRGSTPAGVRSVVIRRRDDGSFYGWAASAQGVFYTGDGRTWTQQKFDKSELIEVVGIVNERSAWAVSVGRGVFRTENRGKTWSKMHESNLFAERGDYEFVDFRDAENGTAIVHNGAGWAIYETTDGGEFWNLKDVIKLARAEGKFALIRSPTGVHVYAGKRQLYRRGELPVEKSKIELMLERASDNERPYPQQRKIWMLSERHFTEEISSRNHVGPNGNGIRITSDGGKSWTRAFFVGGVNDMEFTNSNNGILVGPAGRVTRTSDGGLSWTTTLLPTRGDFQAVDFINDRIGWIAGGFDWSRQQSHEDRIWKTVDGGATWKPVGRFEQGRQGEHGIPETAYDIHFKNENEGWIATHGSTTKLGPVEVLGKIYQNKEYGRILHTTDGGKNWQQVFMGVPMRVIARNGDALVVGGYDIMFSADGTKWTQASGSPPLRSIAFLDDWSVMFCGESSGWMRSVDKGKTWQSDLSRTIPSATTSVTFVNSKIGWSARMPRDDKDYRGITMTTDGGKTWVRTKYAPKTNDPGVCWTIRAVDKNHAWAICGGTVFRFLPGE